MSIDDDGNLVIEDTPEEDSGMEESPEENDDFESFFKLPEEDGTSGQEEEEAEEEEKLVPYKKLESVSRTNQALKKQIAELTEQVSKLNQGPDYSNQLRDLQASSVEDALKNALEDKKYLDTIEALGNNPIMKQAIDLISKETGKMTTSKTTETSEDPRVSEIMETLNMQKRQSVESHFDELTKNWTPIARKSVKQVVTRSFDYDTNPTKETVAKAIKNFCSEQGLTQKDVMLPQSTHKKVKTSTGKSSTRAAASNPKLKSKDEPEGKRFKSQKEWAAAANRAVLEGLSDEE